MTADEREQLRERLMQAASEADDTVVTETMEVTRDPVSVGEFYDADERHKGSGRVAIHQLEDGSYIVRLEDFSVTRGPALVVALARHRDPASSLDVQQGFIKIGPLKGNVGDQNYPLPPNIDAATFGSVVIWCELFDVMFAAATLNVL